MPDLLTFSALLPRLRGVPLILNVHDTFPELFATKYGRPPGDILERVLEGEERLSSMLASRVITVTDQAKARLEGRGVGVGRTTVVMNSPDERVFGPARAPKALPQEGPVRVIYHGGLAPRFGVQTLIEAMRTLRGTVPQIELRVCGSGEDRDRLAALAASIDPERIDVAVEPVPFALIPRELEAAHIGVVPTLEDRFTELPLPVKLLEYVHMGLPVVASRLPGISDGSPSRICCPSPPATRSISPGRWSPSSATRLRPPRARQMQPGASRTSPGSTSGSAIWRWWTSWSAAAITPAGPCARFRPPRPEPSTRQAHPTRASAPEPPERPARPSREPTRR